MTTVQFKTIANAIAGLTFTGINTKTTSTIPLNAITECPLFMPRPDDFITEIQFSRESFGMSGSEKMNLSYTMNWQYFHAPVGQILSFQDYSDMLDNVCVILQTIANNDTVTGAVDIQIRDIPRFAQLADVSGNYYHGAQIALRILEFIN